MKTSIRIAYRIVKSHQGDDNTPIYIPQYQDEESYSWHNFKKRIKGRCGGYNTASFSTLENAKMFLEHQKPTEDAVVHYEDLVDYSIENPPDGL